MDNLNSLPIGYVKYFKSTNWLGVSKYKRHIVVGGNIRGKQTKAWAELPKSYSPFALSIDQGWIGDLDADRIEFTKQGKSYEWA